MRHIQDAAFLEEVSNCFSRPTACNPPQQLEHRWSLISNPCHPLGAHRPHRSIDRGAPPVTYKGRTEYREWERQQQRRGDMA